MKYPEQYRAELLTAIREIDLDGVGEAIKVFRETRAHGRCIFVCGAGKCAEAASELLCEMVKKSSLSRAAQFRILALSEKPPQLAGADLLSDRVFADQLRNVAEHGDVVVAISNSGNSASALRAIEYANRIGCYTICITGRDGGQLATVSKLAILVPASHQGSIEDAHLIICHMIGYYFANIDLG